MNDIQKNEIIEWIEGEQEWDVGVKLLQYDKGIPYGIRQHYKVRNSNIDNKTKLLQMLKDAVSYQPVAKWIVKKKNKNTDNGKNLRSKVLIEVGGNNIDPIIVNLKRKRQHYYNKASKFYNDSTNPKITSLERAQLYDKMVEADSTSWEYKTMLLHYLAHGELPEKQQKKKGLAFEDIKLIQSITELNKLLINKVRPGIIYAKNKIKSSAGLDKQKWVFKLQQWNSKKELIEAHRENLKHAKK